MLPCGTLSQIVYLAVVLMDRGKDILPFLSAILSQHEFDVEVYSVLLKLVGSVLMSHRFSQSCDINQLNT